jgi:hypothetical protein
MTTYRMPDPKKLPFLAKPVPMWQRKTVGVVVLAYGILLASACFAATARMLLVHQLIPLRPLTMLATGAALALFLLVVGNRLVLGKSVHRDSLLPRPAWLVLATLFAGSGAWMVTVLPLYENAIPLAACLLFATVCLGVALRPRSSVDRT